jgi:CheY-like chemotaxis protein
MQALPSKIIVSTTIHLTLGPSAECDRCEQGIAGHGKAWHLCSHMHPNRLSDLTIVVVEDHDDLRRYLGLFLNQAGAKVVLARDAFEGLAAVKSSHPDLVISDIKMPGIDGLEFLRQIRALDPDSEGNVPVIAMTALVGQADRTRLLSAGFQACLPKPFTPSKLLENILTVLNH